MIKMVIVSVLLAVVGIALAIWRERRLSESISGMVFTLKGNWRWLWTIWMWAVTFCIGIPTIEVLNGDVEFLGFLMMGSLMFVGAMPLFELESKKEHYFFAAIGGLLSQVCVAMISPWWLFTWLAFAALLEVIARDYSKKDYREHWYDHIGCFLCEVICYVALVGAMVTKLL